MGQNAKSYGSYTHLVIKAHQHAALKTSIHSHSDFWKCIRSFTIFDSPNVCKIEVIRPLTCRIMVHYLTKRGTYSRLKDKVRDNEPLSGSPIHLVNVQPA